ncbi:MAG: hypothetical protein JXR96_28300 [Deltaproteobacteria bacterium]|nr:hypothetical protein [Deltaproteobacteria bacterium]
MRVRIAAVFAVLLAASCAPPEGLRSTPPGDGPVVVFDLDARPFPEMPFPNDMATRPDPRSPTGRRLNVSLVAPTGLERSVRARIDELTGFGTFMPISLRFDAPLDVEAIRSVRHDDGDRSDDLVLLLVVDRDSPLFGQAAYLDLGQGYYPLTLEQNDNYFASDPRAQASNLLYETTDEDADGDGALDPGEDTDSDGVLDRKNVYPGSGGDPYRDLLDFYELETDSLSIRPVLPLRPQTRYAVVLTDRLRGEGGPVRSPFAYVHHLDQRADLEPLADALAANGRSLDEVAFAWTFTTMRIHQDLDSLRDGLHGQGPFAHLADDFPPEPYLHQLRDRAADSEQRLYVIEAEEIEDILVVAGQFILPLIGAGADSLEPLLDSYQFVDYFVSGSFRTPYLLAARDEVWDLDPLAGRAELGEQEVTFWLSVPKAHRHVLADGTRIDYTPPFPVVVYVHGSTSTRLESLGWAGTLGRYGFAVLGIDAVGHGLSFDRVTPELEALVATVFDSLGMNGLYGAIKTDRARDLNGDGWCDSGGDFWSADVFHTRDVIRQTVVDIVQAVRMLRSFDGLRRFAPRDDPRTAKQRALVAEQTGCDGRAYADGAIPFTGDLDCDGEPELAGDFDGDGIVDVGGPGVLIAASGVSLGGIVSSLAASVEPEIARAAPISGGAGLADIAVRCLQPGVVEAVYLKLFGPLVVGVPYAPVDAEPVVFDDPATRKIFQARYSIDQVRGIWAADDPGHAGRDYALGAVVKDHQVTLQSPPAEDVELVIDYDAIAQPELGVVPPGPISLRVEYDLYDVNKELRLTIADHVELEQGDLVRLTNLENLEARVVTAGPYGRFRVAVAADSAEDLESEDPEARREALLRSDRLQLDLLAPDGSPRRRIQSLESDIRFHGTQLREGDPLLGLVEGFGLERNTPDLRRMVQLCQLMLDPADPANWVDRARDRLLVILTVGDMNVPINTGITLARAAGLLRFDPYSANPVPERADGLTEHRLLFDWWVHEGLEKLDRFPARPFTLADPDDLDRNRDGFEAPSPAEPLRATRYDAQGRPVAGVRFPYLEPDGLHGFRVPAPSKAFDIDSFMINMMGWYFQTGEIADDLCLEDYSCDFIPRELVPIE